MQEKIKKSLKYSILDGSFYAMMVNFGESFFSAFAIFLKANSLQIGILASLPHALGSFSQLLTHKLISVLDSRKKLVYLSALFQALMYLPIAMVFFFPKFKIESLIIFCSIYWIFGMVFVPAWNSWMGDIVAVNERGMYFGKRNRIAGTASFFSLLAAGYILQKFQGEYSWQYIGFAIIFGIALIARILSFLFLTKKYEPEYVSSAEENFSFFEFVKGKNHKNFRRLVYFICLMNFCVYLASPFFAAYMLYDLKFSFFTFTIINASSIIAKNIFMPIWGKFSDEYGAKRVLSLAGYLMPIIPILWIFSSNVYYLTILQVYNGFIWSAFEISSFTFLYDTTTAENRVTSISYYNILNGAAMLSGALTGGLIIKYSVNIFPNIFWSKYFYVFLISFILRYIVSFTFIKKLKDVRNVIYIGYHNLLYKVITAMPDSMEKFI